MHSMNCRPIYGGGNECETNIGLAQSLYSLTVDRVFDRCQGFKVSYFYWGFCKLLRDSLRVNLYCRVIASRVSRVLTRAVLSLPIGGYKEE